VAELVHDQVVRGLRQRSLDQDQRAELVAREAPEAGDPEQPRRVEDPHAVDLHRPRIEVELVQPRLGARDRGDLFWRTGHVETVQPAAIFMPAS